MSLVEKSVGTYFYRETIEPFFQGPEKPSGEAERKSDIRLVRARVEIYTVPVVNMTCVFKDPDYSTRQSQFKIWLYGTQQKIRINDLPKIWTMKTTAWLVGLGILGVPAGYALSKLLQLIN